MSQSAGGGAARPDMVNVAGRLSLVFGKDKAPSTGLEAAWDDHKRKLEDGLPSLTYGSNKYVICVAAAGSVPYRNLRSTYPSRTGRSHEQHSQPELPIW